MPPYQVGVPVLVFRGSYIIRIAQSILESHEAKWLNLNRHGFSLNFYVIFLPSLVGY